MAPQPSTSAGALALGIDRDQINEAFWLGIGTPGSVAPRRVEQVQPRPRVAHEVVDARPRRQANDMLDKLGLDKKDAEGFRLRTDGQGRLRLEI